MTSAIRGLLRCPGTTKVHFAVATGYGPSPELIFLLMGILGVLVYLAYRVPDDLLSVRSGSRRIGPWGLALNGAVFFLAWVIVLVLASGGGRVPAVAAALVVSLVVHIPPSTPGN